MALNVGSLNRRLTLRSRDSTTGDFNDVDTVWGSLAFIGGTQESLRSGAPMAIGQSKIVIRFREDLKAEWQVFDVETSRVFQISGYGDPDGKKSELQLIVTEIQ